MSDMNSAIQARMDAQRQKAADRRQAFEPDPELERLAERMDEMREISPKEYADANFGGVRDRVMTYRRRKAEHEENTK